MSGLFKNIGTYFHEYCNCTSVHGFRYFGEKRTIFEKVWWFIVFTACLGACVLSIYISYSNWEKSPVIVNFANRGTPIYEIPWPAVTICPQSTASGDKFNFTDLVAKKFNNSNLTMTEETQFAYMSLMCSNKYWPEYCNFNNATVSEEFYDFVDEVKPKFQINNCTYRGKNLTCDIVFKPIFTEEGICYTFNMLDRSEMFRENVVHYRDYQEFLRYSTNWMVDYGYTSDAGLNPYPRRALLAGAKNGLSFTLTTYKKDLDYLCKIESVQGYKVLLHAPTSFPNPSQEYFMVPLDQNVAATVYPTLISTSDTVKAYSVKRRRCYFQSEKYLQYFKIYTAVNCDIECLTNSTLDDCDCVTYFMPRDNSTKICGPASVECMHEAERNMQVKQLEKSINKKKSKKKLKSQPYCDCLPACTDLAYDAETTQSNWDWGEHYNLFWSEPMDDKHMSALTIYFNTDDFITSERNELFGPIAFLANFGGLLGLFTGFSVLSLTEILYFLSVRIICNKWLYGKWAGQDS